MMLPIEAQVPRRFAFFDVDETIIRDKSMFGILEALDKADPTFPRADILRQIDYLRAQGADRVKVNREFYAGLKGLFPEYVRRIAKVYFDERFKERDDFFIKPVVELLHQHAACGVEPVFVSGSSVDFLEPLAHQLGVRHVLATRLSCGQAGDYTGVIDGIVMIGPGKRQAVEDFIVRHGATAAVCYAYGDHPSDQDFLEAIGFPSVIAGNPEFERTARERSWPILSH